LESNSEAGPTTDLINLPRSAVLAGRDPQGIDNMLQHDRMVDLNAAAQLADLNERTVRRAALAGEIPFERKGGYGKIFLRLADLRAWVKRRQARRSTWVRPTLEPRS
jgi:hypothetical protein